MTSWLPPPLERPAPSRVHAAWLVGSAAATLVLAAASFGGCLVFAPRVYRIEGHSMSPTLMNDDRTVFVKPRQPVGRGDIVSYRYPRNPAKRFIGRLVGLPGERVAIVEGRVHIDGRRLDESYLEGVAARPLEQVAELRLGADEYYVLGDNRGNSSDSREWGPVAGRFIDRRFACIWWRTARGRPAFAAADGQVPDVALGGTWEYRQANPARPDGLDAEGERLVLERGPDGRWSARYFGLERTGDHGLFYTVVDVEGLEVDAVGALAFRVPARALYRERPDSLAAAGRLAPAGRTSDVLAFSGRRSGDTLVVTCTSAPTACPDTRMQFRRIAGAR